MDLVTDDYDMTPSDQLVLVDPSKPFIVVRLPYVGECPGKFYSINNFCTSGNTVHIEDRGDSTEFVSPTDLPMGGAVVYFSNGIQWLLMFSNV